MKSRLTVTIEPEILQGAKDVLTGTGITLSGFIGITLQGLIDSNAKPMRAMYEDMAKALIRNITATGEPKKPKSKK